jgi:hypothetical protein
VAAKLAMNSVGIKKKRQMPTAKRVKMKAVVMARRRHVANEIMRVEMAKAMNRSSGTPSRAI